ncbi:MAG: hypothetical protein NXI30_27500 [bacterium]|nr:hypothetical protein [bacterium]
MDPVMIEPILDLGTRELRVTLVVCAISLIAVWIPLARGTLLCWRARRATALPRDPGAAGATGVVALTRAVATSATRQLDGDQELPFVRDAAKQLVIDDYETSFAQPISMYANILPPIGFIGTTCGLAVLLLSMRISNDVLQMGALALALSSTIFALVGYATLESLKIGLYGRLARSIDAGLEVDGEEEAA